MNPIDVLRRHGIDVSSSTEVEYRRDPDHATYLLYSPRDQVHRLWQAIRELVPETGYWPVIGWKRFQRPPKEEVPPEEILALAAQVDLDAQVLSSPSIPPRFRETEENLHDDGTVSAFQYQIHEYTYFAVPAPGLVPLALLPTDLPWKVPAYLNISGDDPRPEVQVAVMKRWYEQWGAEVVAAIPWHVELRVLTPPITLDAALALANEQYAYSPDLVEQDVGNLGILARMLLKSTVWWFWWD